MEHVKKCQRLFGSRRALGGFLLPGLIAFSMAISPVAFGQTWLDYVEVTEDHILADEDATDPLGQSDPFEKDLAVGDLDRDGDLDLVIARKVAFSIPGGRRNALYLNNGDGVFTERSAELAPGFLDPTDDRDIALADLDGDGWLDVVTATTFAEQPRVYLNLGDPDLDGWDGLALAAGRLPALFPGPKFCAVAVGDLDNDGDADLFFTDYNNNLEDRLLINDGEGLFSDETSTRLTLEMSVSKFGSDAQIIDMNGDGYRDIVKIDTGHLNTEVDPNVVLILYNVGAEAPGTFEVRQVVYARDPYMVAVEDLNNDGLPDLYVVDDAQDAYLLHTGNDAEGQATFTTTILADSPLTGFFGGNVTLADLDADGYRDAVVADVDTDIATCGQSPALLRNLGDTPNVTLTDPLDGVPADFLPRGVFNFAVADFNGDGSLDLWAGTCEGNRLYFSQLEVPAEIFADGFESGGLEMWSGGGS